MGGESGCNAMCWDPLNGYVIYMAQKSGKLFSKIYKTKHFEISYRIND